MILMMMILSIVSIIIIMIFFEFFKLSSYGFVVYILAFDIPVVLTNRKRNANIYMALTMA